MARQWYAYTLVAMVAVAVALAGYLGWQRHLAERENRQVELAVEYAEVVKLAERSDLEPAQALRRLKAAGATAVLFKEQVLADLEGRQVWVKSGEELLAEPAFAGIAGKIKPNYTYLLTRYPDIQERAAGALEVKSRNGVAQRLDVDGRLFLVGTLLTRGELASTGLGFPDADLDLVTGEGMRLILQVRSWTPVREGSVARVFQPLLRYREHISTLLFNDYMLPGYPKGTVALAEQAQKLGAPVGLVEFFPQKGLNELALTLGKDAVRLHSIPAREMGSMTPQRAVDRFVLAATERNMRVLFVRLFLKSDSPDWITSNEEYLSTLRDALAGEGFVFGPAKPFSGLPSSRIYLMVMGLGVIAGGMLLMRAIGLAAAGLALGLLGALLWAALLAMGYTLPGAKLMALAASVVYPTLGVMTFQKERGYTAMGAAVRLVLASSVSLVGAVLVVGLLADLSFMLKINQFSGVKATHAAPLALLAFVYTLWPLRARWMEWIKKFLDTPITMRYILLGAVVAAAAGIFLTRTGNDGTALVSGLELKMRWFLDQTLAVRPRTKEFLIGHPFLMLSFYLGYRHRRLPLVLLGAIGQTSLVNTFTHIHTPLTVSLLRSVNGLWVGILLGLLLILAYQGLERAVRRHVPSARTEARYQ